MIFVTGNRKLFKIITKETQPEIVSGNICDLIQLQGWLKLEIISTDVHQKKHNLIAGVYLYIQIGVTLFSEF